MSCCCRLGTLGSHFSDKIARRDLAAYREHGPRAVTRAMLDVVATLGLQDASLLDVGGGVGVLPFELLTDGVTSATLIEPSEAYLRVAREETRRRGLDDRLTFLHGDVQGVSGSVEPTDLVTLDRVICCDPDMRTLVSAAARSSRRFVVASFPNDRWHIRLFTALENMGRAVLRNAFRTFVHPVRAIDAAFEKEGFERIRTLKTFVWQIVLYEGSTARDAGARTRPRAE
jgi:2-polyprenyl-3-methyl-5-hydroxy-6-metoxy-1,4-benzoquinol methylase